VRVSSLGREYLSIEQLAAIGPWSVDAIEKMIRRGILRREIHYFQPFGPRTRLIFKWSAIVTLIEGRGSLVDTCGVALAAKGEVLDVETATAGLHRLLRG
jgi:hypothetical protein